MTIHFEKITYTDTKQIERIVSWDNDPEIQYFVRPNFSESEIEPMTTNDIVDGLEKNADKMMYMIMDGHTLIGYVSIDLDFPFLLKKEDCTAWISICIGEKAYWGKGIATMAMTFLEETCTALHAKRIELGVFAYNTKAQALYKKMGYTTMGNIENFVYYDGRWHDDIRMEKLL